jgi:hypothetical protein
MNDTRRTIDRIPLIIAVILIVLISISAVFEFTKEKYKESSKDTKIILSKSYITNCSGDYVLANDSGVFCSHSDYPYKYKLKEQLEK